VRGRRGRGWQLEEERRRRTWWAQIIYMYSEWI
jgi:hypothetical protein